MNIEHLRTLITVIDQGSLSAAARILHVSQPAVTKQMQRLEQELGVALLVRGPQQRATLTPAGQYVLAFARVTLERLAVLQEKLALLQSVTQGQLVLAASTIPGEYLLPGLLAAFRGRYPQVQVQVAITDSADVAGRVLSDEADVGLIGAELDRPGLRLERLTGDEIVLVVPPNHPFAGQKMVSFEALHGQPLILREEGSGTRRSVEQFLAAAGHALAAEDALLSMGSTQAVLHAVQQGLGIGFVSARAAAPLEADGHLACARLAGVEMRRDLYFAYLPHRIADPLIAHFLAFARAHYEPTAPAE